MPEQGPSAPPPSFPRVVVGPLGSDPQAVIRRGLGIAVGVALLLLDLAVTATLTGTLAILAMLGLIGALVAGLLRVRSRRIRKLVGALIGADAIILFALVALFVARSYILSQASEGASIELDRAARMYDLVFLVVAGLHGLSAAMPERLARLALRLAQRPALMLAGSFAGMILVGTVLLTLPVSVESVGDVSFIDSLFTITSAVCVTGLTVNEPGVTYTFFGELVILLSIQLGGIGIMTLAALALAFARDSALATQLRYAAMLDARTLTDLRTTVQSIVVGALTIEAIGALLLWLQFVGDVRTEGQSAAWLALFHAVSAFCNAGFSLFNGNLVLFADDVGVQTIMMVLVVLGGLGFPVIREVILQLRGRAAFALRRSSGRPDRMSLASRVVLITTAILLVAGSLLTLLFEWGGDSFAKLSGPERVLAAIFHSVNTRTSGFCTVDIGLLGAPALLWTCVLMFIGGSPGSTAGGIKTTTLATLWATLRGELRGREPQLGHRAIAPEVFRRATAVAAISAGIVLASLTLMTVVEAKQDFIKLLFEVCSAFGTVGLSAGITSSLSVAGKLVIILTMFVGRCGPLTVALAVGSAEGSRQPYRLARESMPIG